MAATNDITGDKIITPAPTDQYRDNYERIFGKFKRDLELPSNEETDEEPGGKVNNSKEYRL